MTRKEEIEKASVDYQMSKHPMAIGGDAFADTIYKMNVNPSFIAGAEWADQNPRKGLVDIDKIASFIKYHAQEFVYISTHSGEAKINEFKLAEAMYKAMEE